MKDAQYDKATTLLKRIKRGKLEWLLLDVIWVLFLSVLLLRSSYGFGLTYETRISLSIIFFITILFFKNYNKKTQRTDYTSAIIALINSKNKFITKFNYENALNDKNLNAPLLMALEYKYGNAHQYLHVVDYSVNSGFNYLDFNDFYREIIDGTFRLNEYSRRELNIVDDAIIKTVKYAGVSEFNINFLSRVRAILFYEISRQLHEQNLSAYKIKDIEKILIYIINELPEWSQFKYFIEAILICMKSCPSKNKQFNLALKKINVKLLAKSLNDNLSILTLDGLTPTCKTTIIKLRSEHQKKINKNTKIEDKANGVANRILSEFKINLENKYLPADMQEMLSILVENYEVSIDINVSEKYLKTFLENIYDTKLNSKTEDSINNFTVDIYESIYKLEKVINESIAALFFEINDCYPEEDYKSIPYSDCFSENYNDKIYLIGVDSIFAAAKQSFKDFGELASDVLVDIIPTVHIEIEDRYDFDAIHLSLTCYYRELGFYTITASRALGVNPTNLNDDLFYDDDELGDGEWSISFEKIDFQKKSQRKEELSHAKDAVQNIIKDVSEKESLAIDEQNECTVKVFNYLNEIANDLIKINEKIISSGKSAEYSIDKLVCNLETVHIKDGYNIFAQYFGDSHGGRTKFYAKNNNAQQDLFDTLKFSFSEDGAFSAFWFHLILPMYGVFWHGAYESDYIFITNNQKLHSALLQCSIDAKHLNEVDILKDCQLEFYSNITDNFIDVSCLTFKPNRGIYISSVRLSPDGTTRVLDTGTLIKSTTLLLY